MTEGRSWTPALGEVGHFIPLPDPAPAWPYDDDGYCKWCGNASHKRHAPSCVWADAQEQPWCAGCPDHEACSQGGCHLNGGPVRPSDDAS